MNIRLRVSQHGEAPFDFDHTGPICNLGRDAACELPFPDKSTGVSWKHSRIDLGPDGAWVSDLQSSNGTFVNGERITDRVLVKAGDEIRLGKNGPEIHVVKVEVPAAHHEPTKPARHPATAAEPRPAKPTRAPASAGSSGTVLTTLLLLVLIPAVAGLGYLVWKQTKDLHDIKDELSTLDKRTKALESEDVGDDSGNLDLPAPPSTKVVSLGKVGPQPKGMLGVLLSGQGSTWKRVNPGDAVSGTDVLTALPGFRSELHFDSGVHALLWGDLRLHETLPILESRLLLHEPAQGIDLDLTVERGRFVLSNHKEKGEAVIRVRFHSSTWEARLPDKDSSLAIELRGGYPLGAPERIDGKGDLPITLLNFATRGKTRIDVLEASQPGRNPDMLTFRLLLREEAEKLWPELAAWWDGKFEEPEETRKVYRQLFDFLNGAPNEPVDQLRKARLVGGLSATAQVVAVLSLGAVEDLPGVLAALEDKRAALREAGLVVLRQWLGRSGDNDRKAFDYLVSQQGFSSERARLAISWLHGLSESDRTQATAAKLFAGLSDASLAVRQLASWRLSEWLPPPEKVNYDPAGPEVQRKQAIAQWKSSVPK